MIKPDTIDNLIPKITEVVDSLFNLDFTYSTDRTFEMELNGHILGAEAVIQEDPLKFSSVPAIMPVNDKPVVDEVLYVNGVNTDMVRHLRDMQALANTGAAVRGLHNSTENLALDAIEFYLDRGTLPGLSSIPAAALTRLLMHSIAEGTSLHLVGYSQGAQIISRSLHDTQKLLIRDYGCLESEAVNLMRDLKVETYASAAHSFVDGPQYVHVVNDLDPVTVIYGLGAFRRTTGFLMKSGAGSVLHAFDKINTRLSGDTDGGVFDHFVHGAQSVYFPGRISFQEMRQGKFNY